MWRAKADMFKTPFEEVITPLVGYCVDWQAFNEGDIKMSLEGEIDFTTILAGRNINIGVSSGEITSYIIDGDTEVVSIPMTFTSKKAIFSTDSLPVVSGEVLTVITFTVNIICTDVSEIDVIDKETSATEIPTQTEASFSDCF